MSVAATEMSLRYGTDWSERDRAAAGLFHKNKPKSERRGWDELPEDEKLSWLGMADERAVIAASRA